MSKQGYSYYQFHRPEARQVLPTMYKIALEMDCGEGNFRHNLTPDHECWGVEQPEAARKGEIHLEKVMARQ